MTLSTFSPSAAATVTRTLVLAEPAEDGRIARLAEVEGVIAVTPSANRKRLRVTYDVRAMVMEALQKEAATLGFKLSSGLFARLGRACASFQDDNLRSQAKLVHQCCSTPRH